MRGIPEPTDYLRYVIQPYYGTLTVTIMSNSNFAKLFRNSNTFLAIQNAKSFGFAESIAEGLVAEYARQNMTADDLEETTLQELLSEALA